VSAINRPVEEVIFDYLRDVVKNPARAVLELEELPENFQNVGKGLMYLVQCLAETTTLAKSLSQGDLNGPWPSRGNDMASPLKALHATLKHLTWQTQQVAKGDYNQRVNFMGDFSLAFNSMIEQLDQKRTELLNEIAASHKKTLALAQNNALFEALTAQMSQWIVVMDKNAAEWIYSNHEVANMISFPWLEPELRHWMTEQCERTPDEKKAALELELPRGAGVQFFSVTLHPVHWYEKEALAFVFTDISLEKARFQKLEDIAYRDTLTKTYNRHFGMEVLNEWLSEGCKFVICFVDMDNLKYVNDKFGHAEGDGYILSVAEILREFSAEAIVCRLGGDEFMLLARNWEVALAEERLERLRNRLLKYNESQGFLYSHSMSFGVVGVDEYNALSASELLSIADERMYEYKKAHKTQRQTTLP
jgi:diguanylate cyclase (GGDEF)-like protein